MTEEEAKTKWCPFVRHTRETDVCFASTNRGDIRTTAELNFKCLGSACMAWRWEDEAEEVATDRKCEVCKGSGVVVTGSGETAGGEECSACVGGYQTEPVQIGYCGLAGKP
jgi:hypothetical protein